MIWKMRTGRGQDLSLELREAIHGVNPVYKFKATINGVPYQIPYGLAPNDLWPVPDQGWSVDPSDRWLRNAENHFLRGARARHAKPRKQPRWDLGD